MLHYRELRGLTAHEVTSALALSRYCSERDAKKFIALRRKQKRKARQSKTAGR